MNNKIIKYLLKNTIPSQVKIAGAKKLNRIKYAKKFHKDPIIIGGAPRSGTSMLIAILAAHNNIFAFPNETDVFCPTIYESKIDLNAPFDIDRLCWLADKFEIPETCNRYVEKSPGNVLFFNRIINHFKGNVKLIHIIRDGRDVITSRHPQNPESYWIPKEVWKEYVHAGLQFADHPNVYSVNYENLIYDHTNEVKKLFNFLEEEVTEQVVNYDKYSSIKNHKAWFGDLQKPYLNSINRWKKAEHKAVIQSFEEDGDAMKLLKKCGYN